MNDKMTIGEAARCAGLRPSALRYYERVGLLPAPARTSGQRRYAPDVLGRLALIQIAQQAGLTIAEIKQLLHDMLALDEGERGARFALAEALFGGEVEQTQELPDGYAFRFAASAFAHVAAFVANERRCCPFLVFRIDVAPHDGGVWLRLIGTGEVKAFLKKQFQQ